MATQDRADDGDPEADERQRVGRQADAAHAERDRLEDLLDAGAGSLEIVIVEGLARDAEAEDGALALGDLTEGLGTEAADRLAADAPALDQPGRAEALEVVADERLATGRRAR